jgi:hypothetical protein
MYAYIAYLAYFAYICTPHFADEATVTVTDSEWTVTVRLGNAAATVLVTPGDSESPAELPVAEVSAAGAVRAGPRPAAVCSSCQPECCSGSVTRIIRRPRPAAAGDHCHSTASLRLSVTVMIDCPPGPALARRAPGRAVGLRVGLPGARAAAAALSLWPAPGGPGLGLRGSDTAQSESVPGGRSSEPAALTEWSDSSRRPWTRATDSDVPRLGPDRGITA